MKTRFDTQKKLHQDHLECQIAEIISGLTEAETAWINKAKRCKWIIKAERCHSEMKAGERQDVLQQLGFLLFELHTGNPIPKYLPREKVFHIIWTSTYVCKYCGAWSCDGPCIHCPRRWWTSLEKENSPCNKVCCHT